MRVAYYALAFIIVRPFSRLTGCTGDLVKKLSPLSLSRRNVKPLDRYARNVIGRVSRFYSRINFGIRCLITIMSIDLSKKPVICLCLHQLDLKNNYLCSSIKDFLKADDSVKAINLNNVALVQSSKLCVKLFDAVGCSTISELSCLLTTKTYCAMQLQ